MSRWAWRVPLLVALVLSPLESPAFGQTHQVWPEIGTYLKVTDRTRLYVIAKTIEEEREATSGEFGGNLDIYVTPIRGRTHWDAFRLDHSKNRRLHLRVGYHYLPSFDGAADEHRGVMEATLRHPIVRGVLLSNRNRVDLRLIDGAYSWRFRDRLSLEKEIAVGTVRMNPYLRAEVFYDSRFDGWARTAFTGGAAIPIDHRWEPEAYFEVRNDTGKSPNRQIYATGLVLNVYF